MRGFIILAIGVCVLCAFDTLAFDSRYRNAFWQSANDQGRKFSFDIQYRLRRSGL
jgi:hypothetical protein